MGYLEDFQVQLNNRDFSKFIQLWEEYCTSDEVEVAEFVELLTNIKNSELAKSFGQIVETALPLWQTIKDPNGSFEVLKLLIDLQNTNSPILAETAFQALKDKFGTEPQFNDRIRLAGLRTRDNFQGSVANYALLSHMAVGKFVFHTGGWGTGEIIDLSAVREQVGVEFEYVTGRKYITFANAFKTLIPLPNDNFLVRRFADADALEKEARENPVAVIKILLRDLGPRSAAEIKDDLAELVIPEKDWSKWWQGTRAKLKKDSIIETPETLREPFKLRKAEVTQEERLRKAIHHKTGISEIIQTSYNFVRDLPNIKKNLEVKNSLKDKLVALLSDPALSPDQELQLHIFLENFFNHKIAEKSIQEIIVTANDPEKLIQTIEIVAFKKRVLTLVREYRKDWEELFLIMLFTIPQSTLRDYILKELNQGTSRPQLEKKLKQLMDHPGSNPEVFVWYFQKIETKGTEENLPFSDKQGLCQFFEAFLILFNILESKPEYRELLKKMYNMISGKRYAVVRSIIEGTDLAFIKEFLLLVSKCQSLSDHDLKILRSLAEVVHPSLASSKSRKGGLHNDVHIIWTTEQGYLKIQDRIRQIGTIEIIENAREVEAARALGDLRENSEYKFACEKRSRLQGELKTLSEQLNKARILTRQDTHLDEVSVGSIVEILDSQNTKVQYTILGPWDADVDTNVLSFQSKLAEAMIGHKLDETFQFRDEDYKVVKIQSFFDK